MRHFFHFNLFFENTYLSSRVTKGKSLQINYRKGKRKLTVKLCCFTNKASWERLFTHLLLTKCTQIAMKARQEGRNIRFIWREYIARVSLIWSGSFFQTGTVTVTCLQWHRLIHRQISLKSPMWYIHLNAHERQMSLHYFYFFPRIRKVTEVTPC